MANNNVWEPSDTEKALLETHIAPFLERINKGIYIQAKDILNKYFGEENNQIAKPNVDDIIRAIPLALSTPDLRGIPMATLIHAMSSDTKNRLFNLCQVYIRFPELEITNGREKPHQIKDLWVRFDVNEHFNITGFSGTRSFMTYPEALVGYRHSHLGSRIPDGTVARSNFSAYCIGTGEINQALSALNLGEFDVINFTLFCLHLKNYVVWESLEGVPHIKYRKVKEGPSGGNFLLPGANNLYMFNQQHIRKIVDILHDKIALDDDILLRTVFSPLIIGDDVTLDETDVLSMYLATKFPFFTRAEMQKCGFTSSSEVICVREPDGTYRSLSVNSTTNKKPKLPTEPLFFFKGKPVYLTIEGYAENNTDTLTEINNNNYAHPEVTRVFTQSYSTEFKETCFRYENFIKGNSLENLLQITGSNLLPV